MDIEKLKIFYQVAQYDTLSMAANQLAMNKSTISRKIAALEESLSVHLFCRRGKKFILTNKGEQLYNRLQILFGELKNIEMEMSNPSEISGQFRIATTHAVVSTWLSRFLYKFIDHNPQLQINITASNEDLTTVLQYNEIAIRPYVNNAQGVEQELLMRWHLKLFASKKYIEEYGMPKDPDDLYKHRIILFEDGAKLYTKSHTHWMLHMHTKFGRPRTPYMVVNSLQAMYQLVRTGVGLGSFAEDSPLMLEEKLVPVLGDQIFTNVDVYYIYPTIMKNHLLVNKFLIFLKSEVTNNMRIPNEELYQVDS